MPTPRSRPQSTPVQRRGGGRIGIGAMLVLAFLLVLPGIALYRASPAIDWRVVSGVAATISFLTFFAYRSDKRRAGLGEWRIPESTLHLGDLLGGWPGAFVAQQWFRHKTSKASFQVVFWTIVGLHQYVAFDSLSAWRFTRKALQSIQAAFA